MQRQLLRHKGDFVRERRFPCTFRGFREPLNEIHLQSNLALGM